LWITDSNEIRKYKLKINKLYINNTENEYKSQKAVGEDNY